MPTPTWHSRGYVPHWEAGEFAQAITFRLGDSLPTSVLEQWRMELAGIAAAVLKREGLFWAPEYFDRAIRDDQHYANALRYIEMNPVVAGLCRVPEEWRYGSAWQGRICASV